VLIIAQQVAGLITDRLFRFFMAASFMGLSVMESRRFFNLIIAGGKMIIEEICVDG
jgi:hypothetical protein